MNLGIDDLYDEDEVMNPEDNSQLEFQTIETPIDPPSQEENLDLITDFLRTRGIEDPSKILFEEDNGDIIERNWNDLTREELLNILATPLEQPLYVLEEDNGLTEEEVNFINQLRLNGLTPSQYLEQFNVAQEPLYNIDSLSDDEVFILDLESRVGEMSDEEAAQALNNAKQNENFFNKLVEGIRKEYKEREDFLSQLEEAALLQLKEEQYAEFLDSIINAIQDFNSIGNLDLNLEDEDKNELADFILSQDENGSNYLWQALQDPQTLARAAWFILNGEEAFNSISDYFGSLIKLVAENQYKKGLEDGKKGTTSKKTVYVDNNNRKKNSTQQQQLTSIDELDD